MQIQAACDLQMGCIPESSFVICLELGTAVSHRSKIVKWCLGSQARHRKSIYLIMCLWIGLQLDLVAIYNFVSVGKYVLSCNLGFRGQIFPTLGSGRMAEMGCGKGSFVNSTFT